MKLLHLVVKDLRLIWRDRGAVVSMLILPLVVIAMVAKIEGGGGILLAVVNEDRGPVADSLLGVFREHLSVREMDRAAAERLVAVDNTAAAALVLPKGMSERFRAEEATTLDLLTDAAQWRELHAVRVIFMLAAREASSTDDPFGQKLLSIEERSLTTRQLSIPALAQRIPGLTVMFVLLNMVFSVAFGLEEEQALGTRDRLAAAPVSAATVLGGKMLARVLIGTAQLFLLLAVGHILYGLALGDSKVALLLVAVCGVASMACFALVVATAAHSREQIIPLGLATAFTLAAVGGCWWPFFKQPPWLQFIGRGMMTTWSMLAMHDVMLRNRGVLDVAPKLLVLIAQGLLWLAIALGVMRYSEAGALPRRRGNSNTTP